MLHTLHNPTLHVRRIDLAVVRSLPTTPGEPTVTQCDHRNLGDLAPEGMIEDLVPDGDDDPWLCAGTFACRDCGQKIGC